MPALDVVRALVSMLVDTVSPHGMKERLAVHNAIKNIGMAPRIQRFVMGPLFQMAWVIEPKLTRIVPVEIFPGEQRKNFLCRRPMPVLSVVGLGCRIEKGSFGLCEVDFPWCGAWHRTEP